MTNIETKFESDMEAIYEKTKEEMGVNSTRFFQMIKQYGGVGAAKHLIGKTVITDGITEICLQRKWPLLVESYVLSPKYQELFTDEERSICRRRLRDYGCTDEELKKTMNYGLNDETA